MTRSLYLLAALALAGCDPTPPQLPPSEIAPPAGVLMVPPPRLADLPKPAGLREVVADTISCRKAYGSETDKLVSLQEYERRVRQPR